MRAPVIASTMPKARSRSLNVKKTGDICPRSWANVPYQTRWLMMRNNSDSITRITWARGGTLNARQRLHGGQIGQVVHHAAQVIDAVGVGNVRVPRLALAHLFGAAMVEADLGDRVDDLFSVELQCDPQNAVRARVLRSDVEENEIRAVAFPAHAPFLGMEAQRLLLGCLFVRRQLIGPHLRRARRVLLTQRVAHPTLRHQEAFQMRMTVEDDPKHVEHFALIPIGGGPDVRDAGQ